MMTTLRRVLAAALFPLFFAAAPADGIAADADTSMLLQRQVDVNGTTRKYLLYIPSYYRAGSPLPLVLVFHGGMSTPDYIARKSGMHELAEREGFIVAYPAGIMGSWNAGAEPPFNYAEKNKIDDIGFVRALVAQLSKKYSIDSSQVFAAGFSNGSQFSFRLACDTTLFAAIGTIASQMVDATCRPTQRASVLHIHGTDDQIEPFAGGKTAAGEPIPSTTSVLDFWARVDGCMLPRVGKEPGLSQYLGCGSGRHVVLRLVAGGQHAWDQPGMDTSEVIWDFFVANARPRTS
jgi:polyhydroxybutyrate depolymerase